MPETVMHPFQAVVVRYGPTASGEALNIGVVLLSHRVRFMGARFVASWDRLLAAFPDAYLPGLRRFASGVERYCESYYAGTNAERPEPIGGIERAFDDLVPRMDAVFVRSAAECGIAEDPSEMLAALFESYVGTYDSQEQRGRRCDADVWLTVGGVLAMKGVLDGLHPKRVEGRHYALEFDHAWQNGRCNVVQALSFDLRDAEEIATKAADWTGRIAALGRDHGTDIHLIIGMPPSDAPEDVRDAAARAEALLREQLEATGYAAIVREEAAEAFAERVAKEIQAHEAAE
jgi:hypothetical protein